MPERSDSTTRTRRAVLRGSAAAGAAGLAGCLGGGGAETVTSMPTPTMGSSDAPVTVAAYEDFACPHCRTFSLDVVPKIRKNYVDTGDVRFEHHDFPIPVDGRWSWSVGSAARAVQDESGDEDFFEFAKLAFGNQSKYSIDVVGKIADKVGVDPEPIKTAARQETYRPVLKSDRSSGRDKGVEATPSVFVDGELLQGYGYQSIANAIDAALQ